MSILTLKAGAEDVILHGHKCEGILTIIAGAERDLILHGHKIMWRHTQAESKCRRRRRRGHSRGTETCGGILTIKAGPEEEGGIILRHNIVQDGREGRSQEQNASVFQSDPFRPIMLGKPAAEGQRFISVNVLAGLLAILQVFAACRCIVEHRPVILNKVSGDVLQRV